ncbi:hypothetical protein E2C01_021342 [Portunus trituberculatus]|uniref:Uncharacterized protein n=1 Tax=Portunus trituberculatus TaxID=210409 RepID=A0A5B7E475_PORTR|nr:hypothetical protein [Portunus trituberculatus]
MRNLTLLATQCLSGLCDEEVALCCWCELTSSGQSSWIRGQLELSEGPDRERQPVTESQRHLAIAGLQTQPDRSSLLFALKPNRCLYQLRLNSDKSNKIQITSVKVSWSCVPFSFEARRSSLHTSDSQASKQPRWIEIPESPSVPGEERVVGGADVDGGVARVVCVEGGHQCLDEVIVVDGFVHLDDRWRGTCYEEGFISTSHAGSRNAPLPSFLFPPLRQLLHVVDDRRLVFHNQMGDEGTAVGCREDQVHQQPHANEYLECINVILEV